MFDIGFWELAVVAVVALLVVGPDELPGLIRNVSSTLRKIRQVAGALKADLQHEIDKADEIKRLVAKESEIAEMHKLLEQADERIAAPAAKPKRDNSPEHDERVESRSPEETSQPESAGPPSQSK